MTPKKIKLIHIDDHLLFIQGVYSLLQSKDHIQWMGHAPTMKEGIKLTQNQQPEVVLLDYFLPDGNGINAIPEILSAFPSAKIIVLTMENNPQIIRSCRQAGAMGFLPKSIDAEQLIAAIISAVEGKVSFPVIKLPMGYDNTSTNPFDILNKREKEIALLITQGLRSSQISEKLHLSLLTVNTHRRNLLQKLGLSNAAQLSAMVSTYFHAK
jgi:DNA-binding NarL/FixJ family response regulator